MIARGKNRILAIVLAALLVVFQATPAFADEALQLGTMASSASWSGATTYTQATSTSNQSYASTSADQNAVLVSTSGAVTLANPTVTKSGGTSASDAYSFYGTNSAVMCKGGGTTTITGGSITTDAAGANGVFSYGANSGQTNAAGDGTTVVISDTTITTTGAGSGGIMTTFGGTTKATNLTVTTSGGSSAPIRTDRGGGWVTVDGGTYTSNGLGSPAIYSTADVKVSNATLVSNKSEGVCIEGNGSIALTNCTLTASNTQRNGNAQYYDTIMIYQSMSGDATGTGSVFSMAGGTLTSKNGHVFHVTNTSAEIDLSGVTIANSDSSNVLLSVVNDGWSGNVNKATVNANGQTLAGDIIVSSAASSASSSTSSLVLNLKDGSTFTGKIDDGSGGGNFASVAVAVEAGSTWKLTGDSYVTSLSGEGTIDYNGYNLTIGTASAESAGSGGSGMPGAPGGEGGFGPGGEGGFGPGGQPPADGEGGFGPGGEGSDFEQMVVSDTWERLWGQIALDTMQSIVEAGWTSSETVVLATSNGYWDGLTANGVAGLAGAPIVMTEPNTLSDQARQVIAELKPSTIVVCGGSAAISDAVLESARTAAGTNPDIKRLWGQTADGTANAIFRQGASVVGGSWSTTAFVCTDNGYWDALSAAPISYAKNMPIFLTCDSGAELSSDTLTAMKAGGIEEVYIVGGTAAVNANVEKQVSGAGMSVAGRLWGQDAVATSAQVAKFGLGEGLSADNMGIATTNGYWDALAGAALCGKNGGIIALVDGPDAATISSVVKANASNITKAYVFGGTSAVSNATLQALDAAVS